MIALPRAFRLVLDPSVRQYQGGRVLLGRHPPRVVRVTDRGRSAIAALLAGESSDDQSRLLARRLIDAGMAHPRPRAGSYKPPIAVVIPVHERAAQLERCLRALGKAAPVVVVDDGSRDDAPIADICRRYSAMLVRHDRTLGPAAARNSGVRQLGTELVAFVDSDCVPDPGWLEPLIAHFADPLVGAVAPRIGSLPADRETAIHRYADARSPLDMGPRERQVSPLGTVAYLPTAALVARRAALGDGFDERLRCGEDVDLVWRMHAAGWRIRYDPRVTVRHEEPSSWRALLSRRRRYGTSAAALSRRHPAELAHVVMTPLPASAVACLLFGRRRLAAAVAAGQATVLAARLRREGVPARQGIAWTAESLAQVVMSVGHATAMFAAPALLAGLLTRRSRAAVVLLMLMSPVTEYGRRRPEMDPASWLVAYLADDLAYGVGVWRGCLDERTLGPLKPRWRRKPAPNQSSPPLALNAQPQQPQPKP